MRGRRAGGDRGGGRACAGHRPGVEDRQGEEDGERGRAGAERGARQARDAATDQPVDATGQGAGEGEAAGKREGEREDGRQGAPPGMFASRDNWPYVGQHHRRGRSRHQRAPGMPGQDRQPSHSKDRSNSAELSGWTGYREGRASRPQGGEDETLPSELLCSQPQPVQSRVSAHDYKCNERPCACPAECNGVITFAITSPRGWIPLFFGEVVRASRGVCHAELT